MYTIDASVWINGFDNHEEGHEMSRQVLDVLRAPQYTIILPMLVLVEVAGAISRTRNEPVKAEAFALTLRRLPNVRFISLDQTNVKEAQSLAAQQGLRGADAVYAAVAKLYTTTLISLDNEQLNRLDGLVSTYTPEAFIKGLEVLPQTEDHVDEENA